ncbi:MAG TPA: single-stranded DNA-binding protein [Beijerinckiaceae bacterium]|nr:single-stranded DNA-binding protein [Rhodoblastus sp.]MCB1533367.1 single-stranded DNA-binding protein [Rhodoblastus sp.]MCC2106088.1 single-stranded DNA-binding protein [Hyphomicrobiales bacterium]HRY01478.1 single-stranded DNA-binding protein [Beijerinckiaceae bacterium]
MPNHSLNRVELVGRITQPELIEFHDNSDSTAGRKIEFRLATRSYVRGRDGKSEVHTSWHNVSVYTERQMQRFTNLGIAKGDLVHLTGHIEYYGDAADRKSQKASIAVSASDLLNVYAAKKRLQTEEPQADTTADASIPDSASAAPAKDIA